MAEVFQFPAFWGFCGGFVYAVTQLTEVLWGETPPTPRQVRLAISRFLVALFFAPIAAEAFAASAVKLAGGKADFRAVSLALGLCANVVWPVWNKLVGDRVGAWLSGGKRT